MSAKLFIPLCAAALLVACGNRDEKPVTNNDGANGTATEPADSTPGVGDTATTPGGNAGDPSTTPPSTTSSPETPPPDPPQ